MKSMPTEDYLQQRIQQAWETYTKDLEYIKAIEIFQEIIQEFPDTIQPYISGSRCALLANDLEMCDLIARKGLLKFPENIELESFCIATLRLNGMVFNALEKLSELQNKYSKLPTILKMEKYRAYLQLENFDKALLQINEILEETPNNLVVVTDKIRLFRDTKNYREALDLCKNQTKKKQTCDEIIIEYINLLRKEEDFQQCYDIITEYYPKFWDYHLSRNHITLGSFDKAIQVYQNILNDYNRNDALASYHLARIQQIIGTPKFKIYKFLRQTFFDSHNKITDHVFLKGFAKLGYGNDAINYMLNLGLLFDQSTKNPHFIQDCIRITNFSASAPINFSPILKRWENFNSDMIEPPNRKMVIVSGWFRTGTTYLFSVFRTLDKKFISYYEPLHPLLFLGVLSDTSTSHQLSHDLANNYFEEYKSMDYKRLRLRYLERFEVHSSLLYSFEDTLPLFDYSNFIIKNTNLTKIPVFQFNRISFLLDYFHIFYPDALVISIIRNPRDIFASIVEHYNRVYDTFPFEAEFPSLGLPPSLLPGPEDNDWEVLSTFKNLLKVFGIKATQKFSFYGKVYVINRVAELFAYAFSDNVISYDHLTHEGSQLILNILTENGLLDENSTNNLKFPKVHQNSINSWIKFSSRVNFDEEENKCKPILHEIEQKFNEYINHYKLIHMR